MEYYVVREREVIDGWGQKWMQVVVRGKNVRVRVGRRLRAAGGGRVAAKVGVRVRVRVGRFSPILHLLVQSKS